MPSKVPMSAVSPAFSHGEPSCLFIGPLSDKIPDSVKKEAMEIRDGIASGTLHSFTGPINKQDGSPWLKAGETADMGTLLGMNFYVEGIEGDIPQ